MPFIYPPLPAILQWLGAGQFANRFQRTVRWWVLLRLLYGRDAPWAASLPEPFHYPDLRDHLFAESHPIEDTQKANTIGRSCSKTNCICRQTMRSLIFQPEFELDEDAWVEETAQLTGLDSKELKQYLKARPFATVHRSIRDDLKLLSELGWLEAGTRGKFWCVAEDQRPQPPIDLTSAKPDLQHLTPEQSWDLLRGFESIALIQPNLEPIIQSLWEQTTQEGPRTIPADQEPPQRIFIDFDYSLTTEMRAHVDTLQNQIETIWQSEEGGVISFDYWLDQEQRLATVEVYPVCLHYSRRAKYLSAYGLDPDGNIGWHNYRLDQIRSDLLTVIAWDDPDIPKPLTTMWRQGELPTPEDVRQELQAAWGFNFYLEKALLIMRFPEDIDQEYVTNAFRHPTFQAIDFDQLPALVKKHVPKGPERQELLEVLKLKEAQEATQDAYYWGWVRLGDPSFTMRLRDWRPNGEVIAPLQLRLQMIEEAEAELDNYFGEEE